MTNGRLTMRQALSVAATGLVAATVGLGQPVHAEVTRSQDFLDGLRDLKLPDPPPREHRDVPEKKHPEAGVGGQGRPRHPAAAAAPAHPVQSAQITASEPADKVTAVVAPVPAPGADAEVRRLKAELAAATDALAQSRANVNAVGNLQATVEALTRKASDVQEALSHAEKERDEVRTDAEGQLARSAQDTADARKSRDEAQEALRASLKDVVGLKADLAAREASLTAVENQVAELSGVKQDLMKQTQTVADLNTRVADLTRERDALKAEADKKAQAVQVAAPAGTPPPATPAARPAPETAEEKEAYISGWQVAGMVRRARVIQTSLGLAADQASFMAGLQDGVAGTPALSGEQIANQAARYGKELESRERARFAAGMERLEKLTRSSELVKRNGTVLFLRRKAGTVPAKAGMVVRGSLKERVLDGRVITDRQHITFDYGASLPAIVRDAIALGQVGSVMEVVCFGADIYPPEAMPPDAYPWSLMQYTITTTGVASQVRPDGQDAAENHGPVRGIK